jgi:hypothetical protein
LQFGDGIRSRNVSPDNGNLLLGLTAPSHFVVWITMIRRWTDHSTTWTIVRASPVRPTISCQVRDAFLCADKS